MAAIAKDAHPITGGGVGYKLFTTGGRDDALWRSGL
jgi:hypothetical protein